MPSDGLRLLPCVVRPVAMHSAAGDHSTLCGGAAESVQLLELLCPAGYAAACAVCCAAGFGISKLAVQLAELLVVQLAVPRRDNAGWRIAESTRSLGADQLACLFYSSFPLEIIEFNVPVDIG